jgi:hypothetical protein
VEELRAQATNKRAIRGARLPGVVITETLNRYLGTSEQTPRFITSANETGRIENESILRKAVRQTWNECCTLAYKVCPPRSRSGKVAFIQFNQSNMEFLNEAVEWMSYIYKARSKPESGTVYFSDRQEVHCCSLP